VIGKRSIHEDFKRRASAPLTHKRWFLGATIIMTICQLCIVDVAPHPHPWSISNAILWATLTVAFFMSSIAIASVFVLLFSFLSFLWALWSRLTKTDGHRPPLQLK